MKIRATAADFILSWLTALHIEDMPEDVQEKGKAIVSFFDYTVDSLRNPKLTPNRPVARLATVFWRLVGSKITPAAIHEAVPSMSFMVVGQRLGVQQAVVMVPPTWVELCLKDRWMQFGAIVFNASQAADYYFEKIDANTPRRGRAYEAEFYLTALKEPRTGFRPNDYQRQVLDENPQGLDSLPEALRYPLRPVVAGDFKMIEEGLIAV